MKKILLLILVFTSFQSFTEKKEVFNGTTIYGVKLIEEKGPGILAYRAGRALKRTGSTSSSSGSGVIVYNVKSYGAVGDGVTNDQAAIQNTISACMAQGGGTVYFPIGKYLVSGAVDGASNAQIYLPLNSYSSSSALKKIKFLGEISTNFYSNPFTSSGSNTPPVGGVIIESTLLSNADVIGSRYENVSWGDFNFIHFEMENITVDVRSKTTGTDVAAQNTGVNASRIAMFEAKRCAVRTTSNQDATVTPASTAFGFRMPANNNFVFSVLEDCLVTGMYTGVEASEHTTIRGGFIDFCYRGINCLQTSHSIRIDNICIARSRTGIRIENGAILKVDNISFESDPSGVSGAWHATVYDIDDASSTAGSALGTIFYMRVNSSTGKEPYGILRNAVRSNILCYPIGYSLPIWTTATRPNIGCHGWNTNSNKIEYSTDGTTFTNLP